MSDALRISYWARELTQQFKAHTILAEDPSSVPSYSLQLPVSPVSEDLTPSSGFPGYLTSSVCPQRGTYIQIIEK